MKTITLCLFAILIFSSCGKYYDDKYEERIKFSGMFNDTLVEVDREINELTFEYNFTESLGFENEVYLRFSINCNMDSTNDNCYYMDIEVNLEGLNKKVNAKNIAKAINSEYNWNDTFENSLVIRDCENGACEAYEVPNSSDTVNFRIEADHKGDWLFLEGTIYKYPLFYSTGQDESGLVNGTFDIAVKIEN